MIRKFVKKIWHGREKGDWRGDTEEKNSLV